MLKTNSVSSDYKPLPSKTSSEEYDEVTGTLIGVVLKQRYQIGEFIDQG